jgi:hypothetical protein
MNENNSTRISIAEQFKRDELKRMGTFDPSPKKSTPPPRKISKPVMDEGKKRQLAQLLRVELKKIADLVRGNRGK